MPGIGLQRFGIFKHPFDPRPGHLVIAPAACRDLPFIHQFADILGNRLRGHPEFFGNLLLPDCRLVLCNLNKNLQS